MSPEYFATRGWWTPNQIRDSLAMWPTPTTETVQLYRVLAMNEETRRKSLPEQYVKCPRCYGHHEQLGNIDSLCEKCEAETAPFCYDQAHK
jgi:hypothetical protein